MDGSSDLISYETKDARTPPQRLRVGAEFWRTAALTVAPIMIFAVAALTLLAVRDNDLREAALARTATAFTTEIDRAFGEQAAAIMALSASDSLDHDEFAAFHREATRVMATQPNWVTITLSDPATGQQIVNTLRPLGTPLPVFPDLEPHQRAVREKAPVFVSRPHAIGATTARPVYGIHAPALRNGHVKYVLSATFTAALMENLLKRTPIPADVHGLIVNENGRLLARIAEGGAVTLMTGDAAMILPAEIYESEDAAAVAPVTGWSVHLKRGLWSELQFTARRLWLLAVAGVLSVAVGLFSLFSFMAQRNRAEESLETRVQVRTHELAGALGQKDVLVEELHHRVNNNLQIVGSLVRVQERAMGARGSADDAAPLRLLRDRLGSLFLVHKEMSGPMPELEISAALKRVGDAAMDRAGATMLSGDTATVRRDPALIVSFALCEFLRPAREAGAAEVAITVERRADVVHITAAHMQIGMPPLAKEQEELILLLADQGRGTARIDDNGVRRQLIMQVHAVP